MFFSRKKEKGSSGVSKRSEGERSEPERNGETPELAPAPVSVDARDVIRQIPDTEVAEKPRRRKYPVEYKKRILEEADKCTESGQIGALLRREGLYSSLLVAWRRQRAEGVLQGLSPQKRGAKERPKNPLEKEVQQLQRENEKLKKRLKQAEIIIEAQKKISEILGIGPKSEEDGGND
jgi:transposase-like protein